MDDNSPTQLRVDNDIDAVSHPDPSDLKTSRPNLKPPAPADVGNIRFPEPKIEFPDYELPKFELSEFTPPATPEYKFDDFELSLQNIATKEKKRGRIDTLNIPIIAIDTEYVRAKNGLSNRILCYTYAIGFGEEYCTGIIETESGAKKDRIKLATLLVTAIEKALEEEVLDEWPESILFGAHFLRVDLFTLSDAFTDIKPKINGVRKTVASLEDAYGVDIDEIKDRQVRKEQFTKYDKNSKKRSVNVVFYDSMLLAPAGKSLADVGRLVGQDKIEIAEGYSIEQMDIFQREQPELFKEYAINDAVISYLHLLKMIYFVVDELNLRGLPFTVGGMATKAFLNNMESDYRKAFGIVELTKEIWPKTGGKPRTVRGDAPSPARAILEAFAVECYHGGRNECFMTGPTEIDTWNDFDAPSCYTVILADCRPLDYDAMRMVKDPQEFNGDVCGLARVRFKFPDNTRFPSLPVKTIKYGLYYPLKGESYCTAPEIKVALNMGCEIEILQGFIIPWQAGAESIFAPFMRQVRNNRLRHAKGGFEERLWKEIGNSLYGKLAQGLSGKTSFDVANGISNPVKPSAITNPYFAAHVTGLARALMSEMLNGVPENKQVVSVTTDGFLTNADLSEINLSGPTCNHFRKLYHEVDPDGGEILELKHRVKQLIAMKTRGQITSEEEPGFEPVIAKAGVQVPKSAADQHKHMLDLYLNRYPGQKVPYTSLTSSRQQFLFNRDVMNETHEVRLNLEPDFKRGLVSPRMVGVRGQTHIAFDSVPHQCREDGEFYRQRLDHWRKENCLKTMQDWENLHEYILLAKLAKNSVIRPKKNEKADEFFLRVFLRIYTQELYDVPRKYTNKHMAEVLTSGEYPTKPSMFGYAKDAEVVEGIIPVTASTMRLLNFLLTEFPTFNYEPIFVAEQRGEIADKLIALS